MRLFKSALLLVILFSSFSLLGFDKLVSAAAKPIIKVIVDSMEIKLSVPPIEVKGSTMLHAKGIFDALKINAKFEKKRIIVNHGGVVYKAEVDQSRMYIGDRELRLTQPPIAKDGRIYVPARFVSIVLSKEVSNDVKKSQLIFGLTEEVKKGLQRSLFEAAKKGDAIAVVNLIKRGADPNGKLIIEYLDYTPLAYTIFNNKTDAARALVDSGAKMTGDDQYVAFDAIRNQNAELVELLIKAGLDPNFKHHMVSLLEIASHNSGPFNEEGLVRNVQSILAVVDMLLKHGADPKLDNSLFRAVSAKNYSIIQSLLRAGADPQKVNEQGITPSELSVQHQISGWLVVQEKQVELPSFSITDVKGKQIEEGNITLRSSDKLNSSHFNVHWTSGQIYLDAPNGRYEVNNVIIGSNTYIFQQAIYITIQGKDTTPNRLQLPELNVTGTLSSDWLTIDGGSIMLYNSQLTSIFRVEVNAKTFSISAPAGKYRVVGYRDTSGKTHSVEGSLTVENTNGVQNLEINLKKAEKPLFPQ